MSSIRSFSKETGGKKIDQKQGKEKNVLDLHAMVVLIRPTLVRRESLANSTLNAGVSCILSLRTLEHLPELYNAVM